MQPTMKLRLVKREVPAWNGMIGGPPCSKIIEVLQQWWAGEVWKENEYSPSEIFGEWRDIPIEVEE